MLLLACCLPAAGQSIKGSDTVLPISRAAAEIFMKETPESHLTVSGGGTGVGIAALTDCSTDIAMASRPISHGEKRKLKAARMEVEEVVIAYDALAVVVHPENPVDSLTRQQLEGIFRGKITNWKEVGGPDMKIITCSRETTSGTYDFFKQSALRNKKYMQGMLSMPATGAVVESVSQAQGAIGYVGLAYLTDRVKAVAISYDNGKHYAKPSLENGKNGTYPVVRPLYYYYNKENREKVMPFIRFILSDKGQNIIKNGGYIPVK